MKILKWLLIFIPISIIGEFMHFSPTLMFILSALAIVPLAGLSVVLWTDRLAWNFSSGEEDPCVGTRPLRKCGKETCTWEEERVSGRERNEEF